jgi:CRP/FNR family transcriptional regulator, cyclic AMP receptor protein
MIERFCGEDGFPALLRVFNDQFCVRGNSELSTLLINQARINEFPAGYEIIAQDSEDNEIHFILSGQVDVRIDDRHVAFREAGTHVGEMAMIDQRINRSASIITTEPTVTASLPCNIFHDVAARHPQLWRFLALELSNRLRHRNNYVRYPNLIPELFLASSKDSTRVTETVLNLVDTTQVKPVIWHSGDIFHPSETALEDMEFQLPQTDFAAFVFGPDDVILSRDEYYEGPRDNIMMELGLCGGALGRKRTFILKPDGTDIKVPADTLGVSEIEYKFNPRTFEIDISAPVRELMSRITSFGAR